MGTMIIKETAEPRIVSSLQYNDNCNKLLGKML